MNWQIIGALILVIGLLSNPTLAAEGDTGVVAVQPLLGEIRLRQAELDRRERELAEREAAQVEIEKLIEAQLQEVAEQRETMVHRIESWDAERGVRIRQLSKIYAAMKPNKAARLLEGLEANLATQILSKMKHKSSAAIFERIESGRALAVSRKVAHPLSFEPADLAEGES